MIHQPHVPGGIGGQATDIEIQAKEILATRHILNQILILLTFLGFFFPFGLAF
jgi:ATP-dependent Clp protease protease subunit